MMMTTDEDDDFHDDTQAMCDSRSDYVYKKEKEWWSIRGQPQIMEEGNVIWMTKIKSLFVIMKTSTSSSVMDGILHFAIIITQKMRDVINKVPS